MRPKSFNIELTEREERIVKAVQRKIPQFLTQYEIADLVLLFTRDFTELKKYFVGKDLWGSLFVKNVLESSFLELAKKQVKTDYDIIFFVIALYKLMTELTKSAGKTTALQKVLTSPTYKAKLRFLPLEIINLKKDVEDIGVLVTPLTSNTYGQHDVNLYILLNFDQRKIELAKKVKMILNILQKNSRSKKNEIISTSGLMLSTMRTLRDVAHLHMSEYCYPNVIRSLRMIQRKSLCYRPRPRGIDAIYVDVSGSMSYPQFENIPRYVIGCAIALWTYLQYRCNIYVFSSNVEEVPRDKILEVLLRVTAFGGTSLSAVITHATNKGYKRIVVVTDCVLSELEFIYGNGKIDELNLIVINDDPNFENIMKSFIKPKVSYKLNWFQIKSKEDLKKIKL